MNAYRLVKYGKSTGVGAWADSILISTKQKRILAPHHSHSSRTGNHWEDTWYLLPGKYILVEFYVTGNGNHHHRVKLLEIDRELNAKELVLAVYENRIELPLPGGFMWIADLDSRIRKYFVIKEVWE